MKSRTLRRTSALAFLVTIVPAGAVAQDSTPQLEEIVVTAAYREQGLQDVPVSIMAVTGEALVETAIQKAEDIQFLVPNFTLTETGIGTNAFIRGIGSGINQAFEQSVTLFKPTDSTALTRASGQELAWDLGWGNILGDRLTVVEAPGDHFSMMTGDDVGRLSDQLQACLHAG